MQLAAICLLGAARPVAAEVAVPDGRALVVRGECARCHRMNGLGLPPAPREESCAGCHQWIRESSGDPQESARARQQFPLWDRYVANVATFLDVPDLAASASRLRPAFIAAYLRAPFKVRPHLPESMVRTPFSEAEALSIATWLGDEAHRRQARPRGATTGSAVPLSRTVSDVREGARLFAAFQCGTCHTPGQAGPGPIAPGTRAAPDLRHVARRMTAEDTAAFIADPAGFGAETRMPRYPMTAMQAARLRDYLWDAAGRAATPAPAPSRVDPDRLPLLQRRVSYAEVRARVLGAICVHCHMDPRRNHGRGGPGNTGGLGYQGAGLDLETWAGLKRGALDRRGRRVSIVAPTPDGGEPRLLARLRMRYAEHAAELAGPDAVTTAGSPGMPLGLPPLSDAQFQLIRSWLVQGAPGPNPRADRLAPASLARRLVQRDGARDRGIQ